MHINTSTKNSSITGIDLSIRNISNVFNFAITEISAADRINIEFY